MENFSFENRCAVREKMIQNYLQAKTRKLEPLKILTTVLVAVYALLQGLVLLMGGELMTEGLMSLCLCVALLMLILFIPRISAKLAMNKAEKSHGGTLPESVARFGDVIETNDHDGVEIIEYSQIVAVYHLPDSYTLQLQKNRVLFLDLNGFVCGDFAGFKQFLRMKRPDLAIPE